ncbi:MULTISPECIES: helix-turn-helix domain-containing protein [unclassified Streptomyces]|uniref:helix-turn-helix domain-containing protein n=1 Tax=unclassified Streptomyces TaxID=2593676 RepID=UPI0011B05F36|nr:MULTISPECIES: AraC family transcriptional regulator [unclassified Streptomyces]
MSEVDTDRRRPRHTPAPPPDAPGAAPDDWRWLTARTLPLPDDRRPLVYRVPPQWLCLVTPLRGHCQVQGSGPVTQRSTLVPGEICRGVPGQLLRFSRGAEQHPATELAAVELSTQTLAHVAGLRGEAAGALPVLPTLRSFDPHLSSMVASLLDARDAGADDRYATTAAHYLAAHLLRPSRSPSPAPRGGLDPSQLDAVTGYMRDNLASAITLDELAAEAALSRYHFVRRFAASTGLTPLQYVARLRVDTARRLLAADDRPVSQVGRLCGFPSAENFARAFRRHVGCSPSEFRRRARDGD